jgi:NADH dehydrogenase [ubiquinone] 1 alpha subcomplex assembly factor 7
MALANAAYYARRDPFLDFTTAPEIVQVFGEILGAWACVAWQQMGSPACVLLVEVGPGRGTLMQDVLRLVARVAPAFFSAVQVHLVENSPRLRAEQALRVPGAVWHDDLESLPAGPMILLANEFLDALPIRQFVRRADGWAERYVADGTFVEACVEGPDREAPEGAVVEVSDACRAWILQVSRRVTAQGGVALVLDYGIFESGLGESLQALRGGQPADPLACAGEADLTAHVDFAALARVAREAGADVFGPVPQGEFLGQLGLWARTEALARANPGQAAALRDAALRLASPSRMGVLFKAMCVTAAGAPVPAGFER